MTTPTKLKRPRSLTDEEWAVLVAVLDNHQTLTTRLDDANRGMIALLSEIILPRLRDYRWIYQDVGRGYLYVPQHQIGRPSADSLARFIKQLPTPVLEAHALGGGSEVKIEVFNSVMISTRFSPPDSAEVLLRFAKAAQLDVDWSGLTAAVGQRALALEAQRALLVEYGIPLPTPSTLSLPADE